MASRLTDEQKETRRVVRRIDAMRKRVGEARTEGRKCAPLLNAFEFEIMQRSLELMRETLNSGQLLLEDQ